MQVSCPNDVKIYNLSAGKSVPEWLSERKRRNLLKKNVDARRRIELIQDFDMPGLSTAIRVSKDGQYILATGIYKPRVKCYDVNNLSLKFERCFDSEVVTFLNLSEDYSKLVFLHCDRHVEFHAAHGKYHRLRVPRFGRDMQYHYPSCDLFIVGDSQEIYRINLERGQFLQSFTTEATSINKCAINSEHNLLVIGTEDGKVEAWDPRIKDKVGTLDCAFHRISHDNERLNALPSISAIKFHGGLTLGVGTSTGNVLLYDIRSNRPTLIKDHSYNLPITSIDFHNQRRMVYSMDSSVVKIWEKESGKPFTSIEAPQGAELNDLCVIPNTGMILLANESVKMQTYYIPSLGPAPHWCSFLDNLTEELEETNHETIYDDYKFATEKELEELGLSHLKGTNLLRAYMHGYFMDIRLYKRAREAVRPFEFNEYKRTRIREKLQESRESRAQVENKLPAVNRELALKLTERQGKSSGKKKMDVASNLLRDERFKDLFNNPDFEVDKNAEEYTLLNPVISQAEKSRARKERTRTLIEEECVDKLDDGKHKGISEDNDADDDDDKNLIYDSSSSEDEKLWAREVKKRYKEMRRQEKDKAHTEKEACDNGNDEKGGRQFGFYDIKDDAEFKDAMPVRRKSNRATLGDRIAREKSNDVDAFGSRGNKEMTFTIQKRRKRSESGHYRQEQGSRRSCGHILRAANHMRSSRYSRHSK